LNFDTPSFCIRSFILTNIAASGRALRLPMPRFNEQFRAAGPVMYYSSRVAPAFIMCFASFKLAHSLMENPLNMIHSPFSTAPAVINAPADD
jgi:hypothetical protein